MTDMNLPNKNDFPLFYAYADSVCKGIKSKKIRDEVKVELFSHLLDAYERNIATGMSREDAEKNAVENMGDTEAVSATFKKLYPFSPESFAKSITSELISGIVYAFFALIAVTYNPSSWAFYIISLASIINSISHLRKINRFFKVVFYTEIINSFAMSIIWAYQLYFTATVSVVYAILIINCIFSSICYIFLFFGFDALNRQQKNSKRYEIFHYAVSLIFVHIGMTVLKAFDLQNSLLLSLFIYPIFLLCAVYSLLAIHRFTYLLEDLDILPQKRNKVRGLFLGSLTLIIFLSFFAVGYVSARRQPKAVTPAYTVNEDLANIKENMLALGFPKERLEELTDNEISKYRGAYKMYKDENSLSDNATYTTYAFYLPADDNRPQRIRYILYLEYPDDQKVLRNGLYFSPSNSNRTADPEDAYELEDYDGAFYHILCDVNGETDETIPFYQNSSSLGCDFNFLKNSQNRRAYFAQTVIPTENDALVYCMYYSARLNIILWNTRIENYLYEYQDVFSHSFNYNYIFVETGDNNETAP